MSHETEAHREIDRLRAALSASPAIVEKWLKERDAKVRAEVLGPLADNRTAPYVLAFAKLMEAKLDRNRHKGDREGWIRDAASALLKRLDDEVRELREAYEAGRVDDMPNEAADVANFAMMIADRAGGLRALLPVLPEKKETGTMNYTIAELEEHDRRLTADLRAQLAEVTQELEEARADLERVGKNRGELVIALVNEQERYRDLEQRRTLSVGKVLAEANKSTNEAWLALLAERDKLLGGLQVERDARAEANRFSTELLARLAVVTEALDRLVAVISMQLARGEEGPAGSFEAAWKQACEAKDATPEALTTWLAKRDAKVRRDILGGSDREDIIFTKGYRTGREETEAAERTRIREGLEKLGPLRKNGVQAARIWRADALALVKP